MHITLIVPKRAQHRRTRHTPAPAPSTRGRRAPLPAATNFLPDQPRSPGGNTGAALQEAAGKGGVALLHCPGPDLRRPAGQPAQPRHAPSPVICTQVSGAAVEGICRLSSSCSSPPAALDAALRVLFRAGGGLARRRASAQLFRFMAEAAAPLPWAQNDPLRPRRVPPRGPRVALGLPGEGPAATADASPWTPPTPAASCRFMHLRPPAPAASDWVGAVWRHRRGAVETVMS